MNDASSSPPNPFDSLESSYDYIALLQDALDESQQTIEAELVVATTLHLERRLQALQLVRLKLHQLSGHLQRSRRLLNDLRMLRRIILGDLEAVLADDAPDRRGARP